MSTAPSPSTELVPVAPPTVFVVDEMQQLLATDPAAAARLADILWHGRKSGLAPGIEEATVRSWFQDLGRQARTVEELGR